MNPTDTDEEKQRWLTANAACNSNKKSQICQ